LPAEHPDDFPAGPVVPRRWQEEDLRLREHHAPKAVPRLAVRREPSSLEAARPRAAFQSQQLPMADSPLSADELPLPAG
jgi:hypothetical protein